jgi:hypothetical protein
MLLGLVVTEFGRSEVFGEDVRAAIAAEWPIA